MESRCGRPAGGSSRMLRPVRMLHGAAEAVVADIVSALGSGGVTPAELPAALDLLVEISYGRPSVIARIEGDEGLARRCKRIIGDETIPPA